MLLGLLEERDDAEDPRAVHHHIDAAIGRDRVVDELLRSALAARIAGVRRDAVAVERELLARCVEHRLAPAVQHDARTLLEETPRGRLADATASARDQHYLVLDPHLNLLVCICNICRCNYIINMQ